MPSDSSRRSNLSTWLATPTSEFQTTGSLKLEPAPRSASDTDESIFAPSPLVQVDRATGYLATRTLSSGEADATEGAASSRGIRRLLPLALVPVLLALLAAGWAMLSTASSTPTGSSPTTTLPSSTQGAGKSNGQAQPQAVPSGQAPGLAGAEITRTPTSMPRRNTPTPKPTGTSTPAATGTPVPTNTPLPTDTPLPTNTPIPTETPAPPTNTPVPPTNTPQPFVRYVVRSGDNLSTIAARFGTTVNAIMRANRLAGTTIVVGQSLIIPVAR